MTALSAPEGSTIPLPDAARIERAKNEVRGALRVLRDHDVGGMLAINWMDIEAAQLRHSRSAAAAIFGRIPRWALIAAGVILVLLVGWLVLVSTALNEAQEQARLAQITPSLTSTITLTPTLTVTPLPTRTPLTIGETPQPQEPVGNAPRGDLRFGLTPTPPYVGTPHSGPLGRAFQAYYAGEFEEAITLIEQAREEGDTSIDSYWLQAEALYRMGDLDRAAEILEAGEDIDANFAPIQSALGRVYFEQGALERAEQSSQRAKTQDRIMLEPYLTLARLYLAQGDPEAALAELEEAKSQERGNYQYNVQVLAMEARIHIEQGDAEQAVALANLALYIDPTSEEANVVRGAGLLELGLVQSAMLGLEDYLFTIYPSSAEAWALLARAYELEERPNDALQAYQRALLLSDNVTVALKNRANYYYERGFYQLAHDDLNPVIEEFPEDLEARQLHARTAFELGLYEDALADLDVVREEEQDNLDLDIFYLQLLGLTARYDEAIELANTLLNRVNDGPQRGDVLEVRALSTYSLDRIPEAEADIKAALLQEDTATRHYYLALILEAKGETNKAILQYEWVTFWDSVYGFQFGDEAQARLTALREAVEASNTPTPTPSLTPTPFGTPPATPTPRVTATPAATGTPAPTNTRPAPTATP
jgi:tetratricopeptide (TPR) repeat protein